MDPPLIMLYYNFNFTCFIQHHAERSWRLRREGPEDIEYSCNTFYVELIYMFTYIFVTLITCKRHVLSILM